MTGPAQPAPFGSTVTVEGLAFTPGQSGIESSAADLDFPSGDESVLEAGRGCMRARRSARDEDCFGLLCPDCGAALPRWTSASSSLNASRTPDGAPIGTVFPAGTMPVGTARGREDGYEPPFRRLSIP